jgi:archaellum component FlaC
MKSRQTTKQDILEAINEFSDRVDERFNRIEGDIVGIKSTMVTKNELKTEFAKFETRMVSKDYLDQKLSSLKGDLVEAIRGENKKLTATVNLLAAKKVFTKDEATKVLSLEPVV